MIRVIAETGIKPLCYMIRDHVIRHQDTAKDYVFRGQWVKVDPSTWQSRSHTTVRVGTGSGNRKEQMMALGQIMAFQQQIMANPNQVLVTPEQQYNAINDFAKFAGMASAGRYVLDPQSPKGQENSERVGHMNQQLQQMEMQKEKMTLEFQSKIANAETEKANAASMNVQMKGQIEQLKIKLAAMEGRETAKINLLKQQLAEMQTIISGKENNDEIRFKYWDRQKYYDLEYQRIEAKESAERVKNTGTRLITNG